MVENCDTEIKGRLTDSGFTTLLSTGFTVAGSFLDSVKGPFWLMLLQQNLTELVQASGVGVSRAAGVEELLENLLSTFPLLFINEEVSLKG